MEILIELVIGVFIVIGGVFGLVGSWGLVKLRDPMQRLHGPTKASTLGVGGVLVGSMAWFLLVDGHVSFHEILIAVFLFLTAPITANFIAKTHMARNIAREDLPESETRHGWSIYDDPPQGDARD